MDYKNQYLHGYLKTMSLVFLLPITAKIEQLDCKNVEIFADDVVYYYKIRVVFRFDLLPFRNCVPIGK